MSEQFGYALRRGDGAEIQLLTARMQGLNDDDRNALRDLQVLHRFVGRNRHIMRNGEHVSHLKLLCKGWAMRSVQLDSDRRQILDFALPGDTAGLQVDGAQVSTCDVIAVTACEVAEFELHEVERLAARRPAIGKGLRHALMLQLAQSNDQVLRLGRMTAYERLCSFLLDIYQRQRLRVPGTEMVDFPITQTVVADALGLSVVHVNRQVMQLRRQGLVTLNRRQLAVHDVERLAKVCNYRDRHFDLAEQSLEAAE